MTKRKDKDPPLEITAGFTGCLCEHPDQQTYSGSMGGDAPPVIICDGCHQVLQPIRARLTDAEVLSLRNEMLATLRTIARLNESHSRPTPDTPSKSRKR
jgi:hypothetical protein